jgi:hypothetical protein
LNTRKRTKGSVPAKFSASKAGYNTVNSFPNLTHFDGIEIPLLDKITKINGKHRSLLLEVLGEFERNTNLSFTRIYPAAGTNNYDKFFEG